MGSDVPGCVYVISSDDVMENVTGAIARNNSEGVTVDLAKVTCYNEVLAYDWESDNTTGTLPVKADIDSTIEACRPPPTTCVDTGGYGSTYLGDRCFQFTVQVRQGTLGHLAVLLAVELTLRLSSSLLLSSYYLWYCSLQGSSLPSV